MADTVRSAVSFQADGNDADDATQKVVDAVKAAGFEIARVTGVSKLIDYLAGEFLVHVEIDHKDDPVSNLSGSGQRLYDDLSKAGLKPHSQPGSGYLAADDSRLVAAQPHESKLLNDSGQRTNAHHDDSVLVADPPGDEPGGSKDIAPETSVTDTKPVDSARDNTGTSGSLNEGSEARSDASSQA